MNGRRTAGSGWKASSLRRSRGRSGRGPGGDRASGRRTRDRDGPGALLRGVVPDDDGDPGGAGDDLGDLVGSLVGSLVGDGGAATSLGGDDDDSENNLGLDDILKSIDDDVVGGGGDAEEKPPNDFGLDDILSSIDDDVGGEEVEGGAPAPAPSSGGSSGERAASDSSDALGLDGSVADGSDPRVPGRPNVSEVNFGDGESSCVGESIISDPEENISPVSTEDDDAEDDGALQTGSQGPVFSSEGFHDAVRLESKTRQSFQPGAKCGTSASSLVDSLIDDLSTLDGLPPPRREPNWAPPRNPTHAAGGSIVSDLEEHISPAVSTEDDDALQAGSQGPVFSSEGFDDAVRLESKTRRSFQPGAKSGASSLVDTLIDDLSASDGLPLPRREPNPAPPRNPTPPSRGPDPAPRNPRDSPRSVQISLQNSNSSEREGSSVEPKPERAVPSKVGVVRDDQGDCGKTLMSAVTDPSESPVIYAYKREDDSVSQITSSLATNSLGPSHLQNIPGNFGNSCGSKGLSRTNVGYEPTSAPPGGMGGRRKIHRKGGRFASSPSLGGRRGRSVVKGSGSHPYESWGEEREMAYARNTDSQGPRRSAAGRRLRRRTTPSRDEDLSIAASSQAPCIETGVGSQVSHLGMGGVSCGAQSVAERTSVSESSSSSSARGFFQRLATLSFRAGRFFLPNPSSARRKKFDPKCSLLDELADVMLEEGSAVAPSSRRGTTSRRGVPAAAASSRKSPTKGKIRFWSGGAARAAVLVVTIKFGLFYYSDYSKPKMQHPFAMMDSRAMVDSRQGRAGVGGRRYDDAFIQEASRGNLGYERDVASRGLREEEPPQEVFEYRDDRADRNDVSGPDAGEEMTVADDVYPLNQEQEMARAVRSRRLVDGDNDPHGDAAMVAGSDPAAGGRDIRADRAAVRLPSRFEALADVDDGPFRRGVDVPFYWHVPRSGGGTVSDVLGRCLHLTLAADAGVGMNEETLRVLHFSHQVSYVNVDTSTHQGISRARKLDLAPSGLADVVISPLLHEASSLFTPARRGRLFALFRHPVDRAASLFYFLQETQMRLPPGGATTNDRPFADVTIEEFYERGLAEDNWVTRFLTNEFAKGELGEEDLEIAKEVLRRKCLVGLLDEPRESLERARRFFGWQPRDDEERNCLESKMEGAWPMRLEHPAIEEGTEAWRLIVAANEFDLRLYEYARDLFAEQGQQLFP